MLNTHKTCDRQYYKVTISMKNILPPTNSLNTIYQMDNTKQGTITDTEFQQ